MGFQVKNELVKLSQMVFFIPALTNLNYNYTTTKPKSFIELVPSVAASEGWNNWQTFLSLLRPSHLVLVVMKTVN